MSRWSASWRVAARIARRDAVRSRGRTALVATMIGLPVLAGAGGGTLLLSTVVTPERELSWSLGEHAQARVESYSGAGVEQAPDRSLVSYPGGGTPPALDEYEAGLAAALPPGDRLVRGVLGMGSVAAGERVVRGTLMIEELPAADLADLVAAPVAAGALPSGPGEVALTSRTAERLDVATGDEVTVTPADGAPVAVRVSAVLAPWPRGYDVIAAAGSLLPEPVDARGAEPVDGESMLVPEWFVIGDEPVTWDDVLAVNALGSVVASRAVTFDPPDVSLGASGQDMSLLVGGVAAGVAALGIVEAVLLIGPAFAIGARRSQRQLALLASSGADRKAMRRVVLANGALLGFAAAVAGVLAGLGVAAATRWVVLARGGFDLPDLRVPWWLMPALVVLATGVATGAAALPARRASRLDVVAALAGRRAEASPRPGVPIAGAVLAGVGVVAALAGAIVARTPLVVGGIVVLELGVVVASGGIVSLVGRLAPHVGLATRFAVRDAARQRARTAPALAAVLVSIAGVTAALVYVQSNQAQREAAHESLGVPGTVAVGAMRVTGEGAPSADDVAAATRVLRTDLPVDRVAPVSLAVVPDADATDVGTPFVDVVRAPDQECPLFSEDPERPRRLTQVDTRCSTVYRGIQAWADWDTGSRWIVDDGTVVGLLGLPDSPRAAAALAAGKAVVASEHDLRPDGTARVEVQRWADGEAVPQTLVAADLPAVVADLDNREQFGLVLPPSALEPLGLTARVAGLAASTTRVPTSDEVGDAASHLGFTWQYPHVERPPEPLDYLVWILVGAAFLVGLGSIAIALSLAAAESRADLATLGAVGASPRTRRRIGAAQAGVLAVTGTVLGGLTGVVLGRVLVMQQRFGNAVVDPTWVTVTPWPALVAVLVGVPALAMAGAWLLTRSRLPMVRRLAS